MQHAAFPARPVDATGAGDVFAAAFLLHYAENRDPTAACRYANAAAACSIEHVGASSIPTRRQIESRLPVPVGSLAASIGHQQGFTLMPDPVHFNCHGTQIHISWPPTSRMRGTSPRDTAFLIPFPLRRPSHRRTGQALRNSDRSRTICSLSPGGCLISRLDKQNRASTGSARTGFAFSVRPEPVEGQVYTEQCWPPFDVNSKRRGDKPPRYGVSCPLSIEGEG